MKIDIVMLIVAIAFFSVATYMFLNSVYWIIIGYSIEPAFMLGSFVIPFLFYFLAYRSWQEATGKKKVDS